MAKLYVVFVGLVGLVSRPGKGVVLVREASGDLNHHGKVPDHEAKIVHNRVPYPLKDAVEVRFDVLIGDQLEKMDSYLLKMSDVAGGNPVVTPACADGAESCRDHLAARVVDLVGAVHSCYVWRTADKLLRAKKGPEMRLKARHDPGEHKDHHDIGARVVANGFLLETAIGGGATLKIGGLRPIALALASEEEKERIGAPAAEEAYVVWVENLPKNDHLHGLMPGSRAHDHHFDLLYDLVDGEDKRWIPIIETPRSPGGQEKDIKVAPGSQCITAELA